MNYSILKKRYVGLDILRIVSAAVVCMFHTTNHLGCDYGILQGISRSGAVFMTAFFMLSGFTIFVNWGGRNLADISLVKAFFVKRLINIVPIYLIAALLYDIEHILMKDQSIVKTILLAPIEVLGIQSFFNSLFSQSHNGGTWFISCILFCYLLYPYFQNLIINISGKAKLRIMLLLCVVLLYSPIICIVFDLSSIYANPLFRCMEFLIGVILASIKVDYANNSFIKKIYRYKTVIITAFIMSIGILLGVKYNIAVGNAMLYSWICLPCFGIIIIGLSGLEFGFIKNSKIINKLSDITYVFYLAQLFSNTICKFILLHTNINSNVAKILLGWSSCIVITLFLRFIEVHINNIFTKLKEKDKVS